MSKITESPWTGGLQISSVKTGKVIAKIMSQDAPTRDYRTPNCPPGPEAEANIYAVLALPDMVSFIEAVATGEYPHDLAVSRALLLVQQMTVRE